MTKIRSPVEVEVSQSPRKYPKNRYKEKSTRRNLAKIPLLEKHHRAKSLREIPRNHTSSG